MGLASFGTQTYLLAAGIGVTSGGNTRTMIAHFLPVGQSSPLTSTNVLPTVLSGNTALFSSVTTFAPFPFVDLNGNQLYSVFVNMGMRESAMPRAFGKFAGLYALTFDGTNYHIADMSFYDALGTGPTPTTAGDPPPATASNAVVLNFRGIAVYNAHLFGWGFDNSDATNGNGPNRLMFSNPGNPFKWGDDNIGTSGTARAFTDSDAIIVGGGGEIIRGAYDYKGRLWIGTNRQLHWLAGDGRDSFAENTSSVLQSENVVSANAMVEGPDGLLYGCSTTGLWQLTVLMYGNTAVEKPYQKLYDYKGLSNGYWDLMWSDATRSGDFPGTSNYEFIWMYADPIQQEVCVVIPFCSIANGFGFGSDTVVIHYNVRTGGFTRQTFEGSTFTAGMYLKPQSTAHGGLYLAGGSTTIQRYGDTGTSGQGVPVLATGATWTHGPYAPFGADGVGVMRRCYAVFAWEGASVDIQWNATLLVDDAPIDTISVAISATSPTVFHDGDYWLDISGTDPNLGNATAGSLIPATQSWVYKRWRASTSTWVPVPGAGGQKGNRATLPIDFHNQTRGTRVAIQFAQISAGERWQVEGFGVSPALVQEAL